MRELKKMRTLFGSTVQAFKAKDNRVRFIIIPPEGKAEVSLSPYEVKQIHDFHSEVIYGETYGIIPSVKR